MANNEESKVPPSVLTIFGATGNLTTTKLVPALFALHRAKLLPAKFKVLGIGRKETTSLDFSKQLRELLDISESEWKEFSQKIEYLKLDFNEDADFEILYKRLEDLEKTLGVCFNRIFYLATAPSFFETIFERLREKKLNLGCQIHGNLSRVVVEKPFGRDLESAKTLNDKLDKVFNEEQIYRIDHYLAKETVQNILAFRFANEIFQPIFNNRFVDNIQIIQAENSGVENRGEYYEEAGALRDVVQNHLLQILAITTMDEPKAFTANAIRQEKVRLLKDLKQLKKEDIGEYTVRGQYSQGEVGGKEALAYRQEEEVSAVSEVETFVALKLFIENPTWEGVPIYVKTGKRLAKKLTTISIQFKEAGHELFSHLEKGPMANVLTFQIQPDEGVSIAVVTKKPGLVQELTSVDMEFCYASAFSDTLPDAYERLLLDIMMGDQTLFPHRDEVIRSWEIVDEILHGWKEMRSPVLFYEAGKWGPPEADELLKKDGKEWLAHELKICQLHPRRGQIYEN